MGHRYEEPVHVRAAEGALPAPAAFVWRGRFYVVREVLGHWWQRTPWWEGPAAAALRGGEPPEAAGRSAGAALAVAGDEQVWRVAASAGRTAGTGTYDLVLDAEGREWRLVRVVD